MRRTVDAACLSVVLVSSLAAFAAAESLSDITPEVLSKDERREAAGMVDRDLSRRSAAANARNRAEWAKITNRAEWEKFRDERIDRLRRSLGEYPQPPSPLRVRVTRTSDGEGFRIENLVYESRPGFWVTANLYVPQQVRPSMPGILLAHAHHRDKPQSELQDMGMTWARAGCLVLVIDQVGYGERRAHPFHRAEDYAKTYPVSRQDYRFRYDSGIQLQLLGDSLMGWMAWDLMRGVDLLLARNGIDPQRIILMGAVAGGGDPAGVTAALDPRIACCVPFNFGGPQPESKYPLPDDAEQSFNLLAGSYWESTRGLRLGGRDDFFHWVIVGSTAPRRLIHAHEFSWDQPRDPAWRRYQKIWGDFYGAADNLGFAHGKGLLKQQAPEASHCTNIGRFHRQMIHPLLDRWFNIKVSPADEFSAPRPTEELVCWTDAARAELKPVGLLDAMSAVARERVEAARRRWSAAPAAERRKLLRGALADVLGPVTPQAAPVVKSSHRDEPRGGVVVERVVLEVEPDMLVPLVLVRSTDRKARGPVVVGLAQQGKAGFLKDRADEIARLVSSGVLVALPDLRGTGESSSGSSRGLDSAATNQSANLLLYGETYVGQRLRDARSVLQYLRSRDDVDGRRIALWGESFAPTNTSESNFRVPRGIDGWPREAEPMGALVALLTGLFDDDIRAVAAAGGLLEYQGILRHYGVVVPHDASVPRLLTCGDLTDFAAAFAPRPLRITAPVDHLNRAVTAESLQSVYAPTKQAYEATPTALSLAAQREQEAAWLIEQLK